MSDNNCIQRRCRKQMERNVCPICEHQYRRENNVFSRDFRGIAGLVPFRAYDVLVCPNCGFVHAGHIDESMSLMDYYKIMSKYENENYANPQQDIKRYSNESTFLKKNIRTDKRVLDIGCAAGSLLYVLQQQGFKNLAGVEPSEKNVKFIQKNYGIPAYIGALGDNLESVINHQHFDLLILNNVLEHILPLKDSLQSCLDLLTEDGKLYIEVPDLEQFIDRPDLYQQFSCEHVNYFTRYSLENLMKSMGFTLLACQQEEFQLYSLWEKTDITQDEYTYDSIGVAKLQEYLQKAAKIRQSIQTRLSALQEKQIYLWGAGTHTAMLFQLNLLDQFAVAGIIDSNKNYEGHAAYGLSVLPPDSSLDEDIPIMISSQCSQDDIARCIRDKLGLRNSLIKLYE